MQKINDTTDKDTRNVLDEFKYKSHDVIVDALDARGVSLEIAIENTERDFNMGTIVRSANAFGIRTIHVIGRRQWNKRGAMATDKYLEVLYYGTTAEFIAKMRSMKKTIIAIDNIEGSVALHSVQFVENCVMIFGQEGPGISEAMAEASDTIVAIEQLGSTRSINVGVAAGIAMYAWLNQQVLQKPKI